MKWIKPVVGDQRKRSGFLFLPKGKRNIKWLEKSSWIETYVSYWGWIFYYWDDMDYFYD